MQTQYLPKRNERTQILPEHECNVFKTLKQKMPCPFLHRRGYCLKKDQCDFLHHKFLGRKTLHKPKDSSHQYSASFLSHKKVPPYVNPVPQPPEGNLKSWGPLPPSRPFMEIPISHPPPYRLSTSDPYPHLQIHISYPRPLMEIPPFLPIHTRNISIPTKMAPVQASNNQQLLCNAKYLQV